MHKINYEIAAVFRDKADRYEQAAKDKFRVFAFRKAATAIEQHPEPLDDMYRRSWVKGIEKIPGVGPRIARAIEQELIKRGITRK